MEFPFDVDSLFPSQVTVVDRSVLERGPPTRTSVHKALRRNLQAVIDRMGQCSAKAQGLRAPVTSTARLLTSDHRLYVLKIGNVPESQQARSNEKCKVGGILKVGRKHLFLSDAIGRMTDTTPVCVLDFYVHESCQRTGYGRQLFDFMLQEEGLQAHQLALDRPSHKFLSFLRKHFDLVQVLRQANNYVVFRQFFHPPVQVAGESSKPKVVSLPGQANVRRNIGEAESVARTGAPFRQETNNTKDKEVIEGRHRSGTLASSKNFGQPQCAKSPVPHLDFRDLRNSEKSHEIDQRTKHSVKDEDAISVEVKPRSRHCLSKDKSVMLPPLHLNALTSSSECHPPKRPSDGKIVLADRLHTENNGQSSEEMRLAGQKGTLKETTKYVEPLRLGREGLLPLSSKSGLMTKRPGNPPDPLSESNWANQLQAARQRSLQRLAVGAGAQGNAISDWKRTSWNVFGIPYSHS